MHDRANDVSTLHAPGPAPDAALSALVARATQGDSDAWFDLVKRFAGRLYAMIKSRVGDRATAEEIAQSVLATVAIKLRAGAYVDEGKFEAYLFRIAMNRVRDEARRRKRQPEHAPLRESDRVEVAHGAGAEPTEVAALRRALAQLTDPDREVIELRHHGGLGFPEMAEVLDEPLGTILARHHRALRKLRAILEGDAAFRSGGL